MQAYGMQVSMCMSEVHALPYEGTIRLRVKGTTSHLLFMKVISEK